jgi:hypothetical protein
MHVKDAMLTTWTFWKFASPKTEVVSEPGAQLGYLVQYDDLEVFHHINDGLKTP